ncbi:MAG: hypothetical protein ABSF50_15180 [Burkholderiaceae bacterium]
MARSLLSALREALTRWRLVVIWIVMTLVPTGIACLPFGRLLASRLDQSTQSIAWAEGQDLGFMVDLYHSIHAEIPLLVANLQFSAAVTLLLLPFLTGMVVGAARAGRAQGYVALIQSGIAEYGRMLRMLIWSAFPLGLTVWTARALNSWVARHGESAVLETEVNQERIFALVLVAILFVLVHASLEAGRAQFALGSRSAIGAWMRGVRLLVRRPLAAIGAYVIITAAGLGLIGLVGLARIHLSDAAFPGFVAGVVITQVIAAIAVLMRAVRLNAYVELGRSAV